jgi:hypothetical protein
MGALFLTTVLSCSQVLSIANRLVNINLLSSKQKTEILFELRKVVPSCPLIIKSK